MSLLFANNKGTNQLATLSKWLRGMPNLPYIFGKIDIMKVETEHFFPEGAAYIICTVHICINQYYMGLQVRKPDFGVSDTLKPVYLHQVTCSYNN